MMRARLVLVASVLPFASVSCSMSCSNQLLHRDDGCPCLVAGDVIFKLLAELLDKAEGRHRRCVAQRTERPAHHVFGKVLNVIDVFFAAAAVVDAGESLLDPVGALAAGNAPAAGTMLGEGDGGKGEFEDRVSFRHNNEHTRPE